MDEEEADIAETWQEHLLEEHIEEAARESEKDAAEEWERNNPILYDDDSENEGWYSTDGGKTWSW